MVSGDTRRHQKSMEGILEVWMPTWWTTFQSGYLVSPSHDNSVLYWTVSMLVNGTAVPVKDLALHRKDGGEGWWIHTCAAVNDVPMLNPALLPSWMEDCPSCTLQMMLLLPGCPILDLNCICKKKKEDPAKWPWREDFLDFWRVSLIGFVTGLKRDVVNYLASSSW